MVLDEEPRSRKPRHPWTHYVIAAAVGLGVWAIFAWRSTVTSSKTNTLCGVFALIVQQDGKTIGTVNDPQYYYYLAHPDSLAAAKQENAALLKALPCKPIKRAP